MKICSIFIVLMLILSGCTVRQDPEVLKPILEKFIKSFITDETGQVSINNFQVTGSREIEKGIEGLRADITATAFNCEFRLEEDTYWKCGDKNTFDTDDLNGKGLSELLCFKKVNYELSSQNNPPLVPKGTILHASGEIYFIDFERKTRPSYIDIQAKFVEGK